MTIPARAREINLITMMHIPATSYSDLTGSPVPTRPSSDSPSSLPRPKVQTRRSFLRSLGIASALLPAGGILAAGRRSDRDDDDGHHGHSGFRLDAGRLTAGDVAILRFLAAAELLETDLWQQYTEITLGNPGFGDALSKLDEDMGQYVSDNTDDELSHADFLNAFLQATGNAPVNLDAFRTLPSSSATGAQKIGRLTNLSNLTVDTSWYLRYRSANNPDFGDVFPQFINIVNRPAIPSHDLPTGSDELQAIANTAAFHFATIEQGGSSLYGSLVPKASNSNVLRILVGIGGVEVNHFAVWHDKAGNAPAVSVPGVTFPDLPSFDGDETRQNNLIMPEPCRFIDARLPECSVIRPTLTQNAGAVAAITGLIASGLFTGQTPAFFATVRALAHAADAARRQVFFDE